MNDNMRNGEVRQYSLEKGNIVFGTSVEYKYII